ncbi:hypothetical protein EIP91_011332 [Steccherinum ochraceum]|uniref:Uncharacterized protein n=1 Tax=Steccherinum ochraceum TaxID=92696 RepID=A0A4R0QZS5_9APHY|nr:hypothetical protein EIP91_011332 [Steccherinum ochraceum]
MASDASPSSLTFDFDFDDGYDDYLDTDNCDWSGPLPEDDLETPDVLDDQADPVSRRRRQVGQPLNLPHRLLTNDLAMRFVAIVGALLAFASTAALAVPLALTAHNVHARRNDFSPLTIRDGVGPLNTGEPVLIKRGGNRPPVRTKNPPPQQQPQQQSHSHSPLPDPDKPIPSIEQPFPGGERVTAPKPGQQQPPPNTQQNQHATAKLKSPVPDGWPTNIRTGSSPPEREKTPWFPYKEGTPGAGV